MQETLFGIAPERLSGAVASPPGPTAAPAAAAPRGARTAPGVSPAGGGDAPAVLAPDGDAGLAQRTLVGVMPDDMAQAIAAARQRAAPPARPALVPDPGLAARAAPQGAPARHATPGPAEPARVAPAGVEVSRAPAGTVRTVFEAHRGPEPGTVRSIAPQATEPAALAGTEVAPQPFEIGGAPPAAAPYAGTQLGVAIPGIAPIRPGAAAPAQAAAAAPRAATVLEMTRQPPESSPVPPVSIRPSMPRGAFVLLGSGLVLLLAAAAFALLWQAQKPLSVAISVDPSGKDRLDIVCEECPDGTRIVLGASQAEVSGRKAYLVLPEPLPLGESHASFGLQRPGDDEQRIVELTLPPVEYRIVPDIGTLVGDQPRLTLKVAALPGSKVEIARQPVALDAAGTGESAIDMTAQLIGPASEVVTLDQSIPFSITPPSGKLYEGKLAFRIGVTALMLEAPGADTVTDLERFMLAGRTSKGAELWVAGTTIAVDEAGRFAQLMSIDSVGETRVTVRATGPGLAPRFASFRLQRVESLSAEASARRQKAVPLADVTRSIADHVGSTVQVSGRVENARVDGHRTLIILQADEGCQGRSCLARLVYGGLRKLARGENVTAIGRLLGTVGAPGGVGGEVPEIDVSLLL